MTKKHSKGLFVVFSIILALCLIACFVNFTLPLPLGGKHYSYSSFVSNLKQGEDVGDCYRIEYKAEPRKDASSTDYGKLKIATMDKLKSLVQSEGYKDVSVTGFDTRIIIQVGNILEDDDVERIKDLIENSKPSSISFYTQEKTTGNASDENGPKPFATYMSVDDVFAFNNFDSTTGKNGFYVRIKFKDALKTDIANATKDASTIYIYLGDEVISRINMGGAGIDQGIIDIQNDSFVDLATAQKYANQIKVGLLDLELSAKASGRINGTYGAGNNILLPIAMALFVLIAFVYLIFKYKDMGWLACFNLLFFVVIALFILQSIPVAHFNFAGLIAMLVAFLVAADGLMTIFEHAKAHYNDGIQLHIAFKLAEKESLMRIVVSNLVLLVAGFISVLMPNLAIQSFGWVALVSSVVAAFTTLALMRLFIKMYLSLNSTNGKKLNFHKGGKNA